MYTEGKNKISCRSHKEEEKRHHFIKIIFDNMTYI